MNLPKISIIIPSFNQVKFLTSALDSLKLQNYENLEVIVVDGGSTDGTIEMLKNSSDIVSIWISEKDNGQTQALNKGFRLAAGNIFGWLNCDERYFPGTLITVANLFVKEKGLDILFGNRIVVDKTGKEIERQKAVPMHPFKYALYAAGLLFSDATFWSNELHKKTGKLDEELCRKYGMDFDWFFRMGINVKKWRYVNKYLSEFTEHSNRVSVNVKEMPDVAKAIRQKVFKLSGVNPLKVLLLSPCYLLYSRIKRYGIQGIFHIPSLNSILRVAGLSR